MDAMKFSRQNYAYGAEVTARLQTTRAHLMGSVTRGGTGFEVLKNLLLSGLRHATLQSADTIDAPTAPKLDDLRRTARARCFALPHDSPCEDAIAESLPFLRELNPDARLRTRASSPLLRDPEQESGGDDEFWSTTDVVIATAARSRWPRWNALCREHGVWFVGVTVEGFAGVLWQDPGSLHSVNDVDGEARPQLPVMAAEVAQVSSGDGAGETRHAVAVQLDGGTLASCNLQVGSELRRVGTGTGTGTDTGPWRVRSIKGDAVTLDVAGGQGEEAAAVADGLRGAFVEPLATCAVVHGVPLDEYLDMPFECAAERGLHSYAKMVSGAGADACGRTIEALHRRFWGPADAPPAAIAETEWYPLCCHLGGMAAQEVIKRGGRFVPRVGCYFADALELEAAHAGGALRDALDDARVLVVGAGALGCESLKNLVMLGVGDVEIVDMDTIELSNLSRQFLFRPSDIGASKAEVAARRVLQQRPGRSRVRARNVAVSASTSPSFAWHDYTAVVGAVDNIEARRLVDALCAWHRVPFLDAGTLGVKANTQVVYPGATETYGDSSDPPVRAVPVCTIKQYPYQVEHCVHWALEHFADVFGGDGRTGEKKKKQEAHDTEVDADGGGGGAVTGDGPGEQGGFAVSACKLEDERAKCAHAFFRKWYQRDILTAQTAHPRDSLNDDGTPFWDGGKRRFPRTVYETLGTEAEAAEVAFVALTARLLGERARGGEALAFEKDDDANGHVQWLEHAATLRARCFGIPPCDFAECKRIAGDIAPAVASTTTTVVGLLTDELCKVALRLGAGACFNAYLNLGVNIALLSEPMPPVLQRSRAYCDALGAPVQARPNPFHCWDRLLYETLCEDLPDASPPRTLADVKCAIERHHDIEVTSMYGAAGAVVFSDVLATGKSDLRRDLWDMATPPSAWCGCHGRGSKHGVDTRGSEDAAENVRVVQLTIDGETAEGDVVVLPTLEIRLTAKTAGRA